jgi:hypothetical protein
MSSFARTVSVMVVALLAGCGGVVSPTGDGGADAGREAGVDGGGAVQCNASPPVFPEFDRSCTRRDDCVVAVHQTDCCGNQAALGVRTSELARFNAAEGQCRGQFPGCGCPSMGILADDGRRTFSATELIVDCVASRCTTAVAGTTARCGTNTCAAGQLCAAGCCGVPGCTPSPSVCVSVPPACGGTPTCACLGAAACPSGGSCVSVEGTNVVCICA